MRKAADYLHISASAINRQIINFEEQLGTPIFERLPRGVRLTDAGRLIYEVIKDFESNSDIAASQVTAIKGLQRGHVSIGALHSFGEDLLPQLLIKLRAEYPDISYTIVCGNSSDIARKVVEGEIDVGICWDPPAQVPVTRLLQWPLAVGAAMTPDHPLAQRPTLLLKDCRGYPVIFPTPDMEFRRLLDRINVGRESTVSPTIEANSPSLIRLLAMGSVGVAFTMKLSIAHELELGTLVFRPLVDHGGQSIPLALFYREGRVLSGPAEMVALRLSQELRDAMSAHDGLIFTAAPASVGHQRPKRND